MDIAIFYSLGRKPTIIVIGESGTGKSSCCNVFAGQPHDSKLFPVSRYSEETTHETKIYSADFRGDRDHPVTLIDTQGFNDPNAEGESRREANQAIIMELMKKLTKVSHINVFLITVNGTTLRRINHSLLYMLRVFEEIFGHKIVKGSVAKDKDMFWRKCVVAITNIPMDKQSVIRRVGFYDVKRDKQIIRKQLSELTKELKGLKVLKFVILDAKFRENSTEEANAFNDAVNHLYEIMSKTAPAMTEAMLLQHQTQYQERKMLLQKLESIEALDNPGNVFFKI